MNNFFMYICFILVYILITKVMWTDEHGFIIEK